MHSRVQKTNLIVSICTLEYRNKPCLSSNISTSLGTGIQSRCLNCKTLNKYSVLLLCIHCFYLESTHLRENTCFRVHSMFASKYRTKLENFFKFQGMRKGNFKLRAHLDQIMHMFQKSFTMYLK